jgi:hypothetical protein
MPIAQPTEESKARNPQQREEFQAVIGRQVTRTLTDASGLCKVQVRPLWGNFYRVNVLIEDQVGSVKIPHSYFLQVDGDGNIIESTPTMPHPSVAQT